MNDWSIPLSISTPDSNLRKSWPRPVNDHFVFQGVYEYCGIQRSGKNTLMVADLLEKVTPQAPWRPIASNFRVEVPKGVHIEYYDSEELIQKILRIKNNKERNWVILFDEAGQYLGARTYAKKYQTECVNFGWQADKRGILWMFSDNLGNSVDVQLGLTVHYLIMPHYSFGKTRDEDSVKATVADVRRLIKSRVNIKGVRYVQDKYNTYDPVN